MARCSDDIEKQLRILKDLCSNMGMTFNTDKTKFVVIKSNKGTYDNRNLEEVTSYKYLGQRLPSQAQFELYHLEDY